MQEAARPSSQFVKQISSLPVNKLVDSSLPRIPLSSQNFTYVVVPQDFLQGLFGAYAMDLPTRFTKPDLNDLDANDTILSNINRSTISYLGEFLSALPASFVSNPRTTTVRSPDNGEGISLHSTRISDPSAAPGQGWTTVETVLIRFDTSYTPSGHFPRYLNKSSPNANGIETRIGYDAAVCVQKYESWIIEAYNTSIVPPYVVKIVGKWDGSTLLSPSGTIQGPPISNTRYLDTKGKDDAFFSAHNNSANRTWQLQVNSDRGNYWGNYIPPPIVGSVMPCIQKFS